MPQNRRGVPWSRCDVSPGKAFEPSELFEPAEQSCDVGRRETFLELALNLVEIPNEFRTERFARRRQNCRGYPPIGIPPPTPSGSLHVMECLEVGETMTDISFRRPESAVQDGGGARPFHFEKQGDENHRLEKGHVGPREIRIQFFRDRLCGVENGKEGT